MRFLRCRSSCQVAGALRTSPRRAAIAAVAIAALLCGRAQADTGSAFPLAYDVHGNLTQDLQHNYEYNAERRLVAVKSKSGKQLEEYAYDHAGERVRKVEHLENGKKRTTYYLGAGIVRVIDDAAVHETRYIHAPGGQALARRAPDGQLFFFHSDHLGSISLVTDSKGQQASKTVYMPYGMVLSGGGERFLFTGQEADATGLMYYGARYYSPLLRRFIQADWVTADAFNPQGLNCYAYASNSPFMLVDPSGNFAVMTTIAIAVGGGAAIGALSSIGYQMWHGASLFDGTMNWRDVGVATLAGAGAGLAVLGIGAAVAAVGGAAGLSAAAAGVEASSAVLGGIAGGQSFRAIDNVGHGRKWSAGLGNAKDMALDGTIGLVTWGVVRSISPKSTALVSEGEALAGEASQGGVLPKPNVTDPKLKNYVDNLYKGTTNPNRIGTGTTADAVRAELTTGQATAGRFHIQKAEETARGLQKWLNKNPDASHADRLVGQSLLDDLLNALGKKP